MAKYQESTIVGSTWIRPNHISIINVYKGQKSIYFHEETVIEGANGNVMITPIASQDIRLQCQEYFTPDTANTIFPILDSSGNDTGKTCSFQELYGIISSLYIYSATKRDIISPGVQEEIDRAKAQNESLRIEWLKNQQLNLTANT
jgi:hypothetical protein